MSAPSDDQLRHAIRSAGLRATSGRLLVLSNVLAADGPVSHPELCERLPGQDRATIYRNLNDLAEAGLLRRFDVDHIWRFEAGTLERGEPGHPHFVCTDCGQVECLPVMAFSVGGDRPVPAAVSAQQIDVQMRGRCDACS